ncbi:MAG: Gfo/Idh/MocA family oxidoreductase [Acidobacteriota bacterium]|nr:Gfo/Idh/MocA family oxidoreductase [Acidobacteriota bacterium]
MKDPGVDRRGFLRQLGMGVALAPAWNARSALAVPGANERLLVGVIGCGSMGNSHMKALLGMQDSANIKVAAVCDVFRKRLDAAAALTGGTPYSDYRTLLAQKELDYVLIATPEHWHHRMTLDALDAGKHIYLEKPMTQTIRQAKEVVRRVRRSKLKLQVGVQGMSDESYEVAGRYIREGVLGKLVMAQIDYSRNYTDDFWAYDIDPDADPRTNLDWKAWQGPAPKRPWDPRRFFQWRRYWDYSGGVATDLFVHRVTRIIKAAGLTFPDRVVASGGTWQFTQSVAQIPDTFNMLCDYPGGPTVALISSMANDFKVAHVIRGHKATLRFTRTGFVITPQSESLEDRVKPGEFRAQETWSKVYRRTGGEDIRLHHQNLQNAIRVGESLKCDVMLGYYGTVVTAMGVQSFRRRKYLKWNRKKERVETA